MIKRLLLGTVMSVGVLGGVMIQPRPAQAIMCGNCASEATQVLNWVLLGLNYAEGQTQTAEMIKQGVELYNQGVNIQKMLERGEYGFVIRQSGVKLEDLLDLQRQTGDGTIIWEPGGVIEGQETMYPEELPPDPLAVLANKALQLQHLRNTSLNSKVVTAQIMMEMLDLQRREEELEATAEGCPGQTCVEDLARQREILAQEMRKKTAIMEASRVMAGQAATDYAAGAEARAAANRIIDWDGLETGVPSGAVGSRAGKTQVIQVLK